MPDRANLVYSYDGSFEGFLCCVFESYAKKEIPRGFLSPFAQPALFDFPKWIETDTLKAERVYESIPIRISAEARELVKLGFLTCVPQKEFLIFRFLQLGYKVGGRVMSMLTDDRVYPLQKAVNQLTHESHKLTGFIRFSVFKVGQAVPDSCLNTPVLSSEQTSIFREASLSMEADPMEDINSSQRTAASPHMYTNPGTPSAVAKPGNSILGADYYVPQAETTKLCQRSPLKQETSTFTRTSSSRTSTPSMARPTLGTSSAVAKHRTSNEVLVAVIEPKNFVLPLLAAHFCDRFRNEMFMIYDKNHKTALIYQAGKAEIIQVDNLVLPETNKEEEEYRRLWKRFYETIAIESRYNPRCRMTLMPKRYWRNMTEFS